jgi:hypothetical protein
MLKRIKPILSKAVGLVPKLLHNAFKTFLEGLIVVFMTS